MTSPLLEAQQKLLQSRTPVRYQPLLTPDNYLNFYGTPQGIAPSAQDLLYPTIQRGAVAAPAATGGSYMPMSTGGDSGSSSQSEPSAWDLKTDAEKAAYYRENPTMGGITRALNTGMQYTLPGQMAQYFDPGTFVRNDAIAAGIDPTGWQFSTRAGDGILGTQIGGTLKGPDLSPENLGYGMPGTEIANQYVPSYSQDSWLNSPEALAWANTPAATPVYSDGQSGGMPQYSNVPVYVTNRANASDDPLGSLIDQLTAPEVPTYSRGSTSTDSSSSQQGRPSAGSVWTDAAGNPIRSGSGGYVYTGSATKEDKAAGAANPPTANEISFAESGGYTADVPSASAGGYDPTSGYDSDTDSGGGGGGGGGKIVCTAMNHAYGFGSFRNSIWLTYSAQHMTKAHEAGYHALFLPLVDYGFKRGDGKPNMAVRKTLEWIARHRTKDLRAEMRGTKRDITGRALRFVFEPLCYAVGKLKGY